MCESRPVCVGAELRSGGQMQVKVELRDGETLELLRTDEDLAQMMKRLVDGFPDDRETLSCRLLPGLLRVRAAERSDPKVKVAEINKLLEIIVNLPHKFSHSDAVTAFFDPSMDQRHRPDQSLDQSSRPDQSLDQSSRPDQSNRLDQSHRLDQSQILDQSNNLDQSRRQDQSQSLDQSKRLDQRLDQSQSLDQRHGLDQSNRLDQSQILDQNNSLDQSQSLDQSSRPDQSQSLDQSLILDHSPILELSNRLDQSPINRPDLGNRQELNVFKSLVAQSGEVKWSNGFCLANTETILFDLTPPTNDISQSCDSTGRKLSLVSSVCLQLLRPSVSPHPHHGFSGMMSKLVKMQCLRGSAPST